ncbi:MAG TPA: alpha/beta hydrolase [Acidimicrobiales bacterium]|nr:alpha/beta hydrolase [Acidimicrobiales bacterium]
MIIFLHGVPETAALWDGVRDAIGRESQAWNLPGFGCPRPEGFSGTKDAYMDWLVAELDKVDEPVDLVGHDWGGGFSLRVGTTYPEKVRSWVSDVGALFAPDYEWHDFAKIWQTAGDGEAFFETQLAAPLEDRAATYQMFGLDEAASLKLAAMGDETMAACILDLYRSATPNPHADWGDGYEPTKIPGLMLIASDDPFGNPDASKKVAETLGARTATLTGVGHFWPMQDPAQGARVLTEFWDSLA